MTPRLGLAVSKFALKDKVAIKNSLNLCKTGTVIDIEIRYIVKQDDGYAFYYDEGDLNKIADISAPEGVK